ncbi:hypothetical protein LEP1GSC186_0438 [Leptospira noguchii serovar Autumnalis str. ZUN142]|uniref:Uncharacterized protein n=1 Tax=Leptospira noguchii serovar Autumnalis str. ZUN142 TaxID=1085540 RepID=M6UCC3_9LEPT|nr:hypothetical protein LEP1GSC186_0438 [Leptospira noguchii serovar Autumnalis str. ZUN142]
MKKIFLKITAYENTSAKNHISRIGRFDLSDFNRANLVWIF